MKLIKRYCLKNNLKLEVWDLSENYWADFWNLKLEIKGKIEVDPSVFPKEDPLAEEAINAMGKEVFYKREIVKVGIREKDLPREIEKTLRFFEENALPYLQHPDFKRRFLLKEFEKTLKEIRINKLREAQDEA